MLECEGGLDSLFALIGEKKDEGQSVYAGHTNTLITIHGHRGGVRGEMPP